MIDDAELLRRYAEDQSEEAFAELVRRHIDFVYATALRQGRNAHRAEDAAQLVFTDLAWKASTLLRRRELVGWLYISTRYATNRLIRSDARRELREQKAQLMPTDTLNPASTVEWEKIQPVLDHALQDLNERDRSAILLRFFKNCSFSEIGDALGLTDDAARRRVDRALDKLHVALGRHGITSTATALALVLAAQPVVAAPAGLAGKLTSSVMAAASAAPAISVLQFMSTSKIAIGIAGLIMILAVSSGVREVQRTRAARQALREATRQAGELDQRLAKSRQRAQSAEQAGLDLQKETADAQAALASVKKASASSGTVAAGPRSSTATADQLAAGNEFLARHPEVKQALLDRSRARVDSRYRPLYCALNLSPEQIEQFRALLIEGEGVNMGTPEGPLILRPGTGLTQSEVNSRVHDLLGDSGYQQFQDATRSIGARGSTLQVAAALYFTDTPVTPEQADQLTQAFTSSLAENRLAHGTNNDYWNIVLGKAQGFLSAPQLAAVSGFQQQAQYQQALAQAQTGWNLPGWGADQKTAKPPAKP